MNITKEIEKYKDAFKALYGADVLEKCIFQRKPGEIIIGIAIKKDDGTFNLLGVVHPQHIYPPNLPAMTFELVRRVRMREQQKLQFLQRAEKMRAEEKAKLAPAPES
jgi:hypothetical protein